MDSVKKDHCLESVYRHICPAALCFAENLYIGEGGDVSCFDVGKQKFTWRTRVFDGVRVHGIVGGADDRLLVHGRNLLAWLPLDVHTPSQRLSPCVVRPHESIVCIDSESSENSFIKRHDPSFAESSLSWSLQDSESEVFPATGSVLREDPGSAQALPVPVLESSLSCHVAVEGWIVAVAPVRDTVCVLDSTGAAYRVSEQSAGARESGESRLRPLSLCPDHCILYSGCIIAGTEWKSTVLIGGTVFSEILVWTISGDLLHRVCGHSGVVFSIVWHAPSATIISTSDDRTVRTWRVMSSAAADGGAAWWRDSRVHARLTLFGHRARVWRAVTLSQFSSESEGEIAGSETVGEGAGRESEAERAGRESEGERAGIESVGERARSEKWVKRLEEGESGDSLCEKVQGDDGVPVVSIGEDSVVCVWSQGGRLLRTWTAHGGASVRAAAYCHQRHLLASSGGDGGVLLWPLRELNSSRSRLVPVSLANSPGGYIGESGDSSSDSGDCGGGGVDFLRSVFVLSERRCLVVSDRGLVKCVTLGDQEWSQVVFIGGSARSPLLASYCVGSVSAPQRLIALANIHGQIALLRDSGKDVVWLCTQSVVSSKIFYLGWLSDHSLLVSHGNGGVSLLRPVINEGEVPSLAVVSTWQLSGPHSPLWLNCAALVQLPSPPASSDSAIVCGDRHGYLHLFTRSQEVPVSSIRVHGRHGVSGVIPLSQPPSSCHVITCGRDGWLRHVRIESLQSPPPGGVLFRWSLRQAGEERLPWDWVCQVVELKHLSTGATHLLATGFHGSEFVVHSMCLSVDLWRVRCGGGHRSWSLLLPPCLQHENDTAVLLWLAARRLVYSTVQLRHVMPRVARAGSISGSILAAVYLPASSLVGSDSALVLAGEDTTVRVLPVSLAPSTVLCVRPSELAGGRGHVGSARALCVLPGGRELVSGGGRGQLVLWGVQRVAGTAVCRLTAADRHRLRRLEDVRYMHVAARPGGYEGECSVAVAASDGGIRLFRVRNQRITCERLVYIMNHPHCLLQLSWIQASSSKPAQAVTPVTRAAEAASPASVVDVGDDGGTCLLAAFSSTGYMHLLDPLSGSEPWLNGGGAAEEEMSRRNSTRTDDCVSGLSAGCGRSRGTLQDSAGETRLVAPLLSLLVQDSAVNAHCWLGDDVINRKLVTAGDDGAICRHKLELESCDEARNGVVSSVDLVCDGQKATIHASQVTGVCYLGQECILTVSVDQRVCVWKLSGSVTPLLCRHTHVADIKGALLFDLTHNESGRFVLVFGEGLEIFQLDRGLSR